jgi:hypothetical protein
MKSGMTIKIEAKQFKKKGTGSLLSYPTERHGAHKECATKGHDRP